MLIACFGFGYAVSLASFLVAPFLAVMLGVAFGGLLGDLPGLGATPAIAIAMAAMTVLDDGFPVCFDLCSSPSCWRPRRFRRCPSSSLPL